MSKKKYGNWTDPKNKYVEMIPLWDLFRSNYSESSIKPIYLTLVDFAVYLRDNYNKDILNASGKEILLYFKDIIDKKDVKKSSKKRVRYFLSGYYNYIKSYKKDIEQQEFLNPIPSIKTFDFNGQISSFYNLENEFELLSMKDIKRILNQLYFVKPNWMYITGSLIIYSGARIREIVQIQLKNLDIKNRWFITEVKSSKTNKRMGIYFFPDFFSPDLEHYLQTLKLKNQTTPYLFPSNRYNTKHISARTIEKYMSSIRNELGLRALTNPHTFRDFLNSRREEKGCTQTQRKFLLNQKNPDVNINAYLKKYKNRITLRELYDKFNPFNEKILPSLKL